MLLKFNLNPATATATATDGLRACSSPNGGGSSRFNSPKNW